MNAQPGSITIIEMEYYYDAALSAGKFDTAKANIYPNPAKNRVYIEGVLDISEVTLYDLTGKMVLQRREFEDSSLNISSLKSGLYIIRVSDSHNAVTVKKLIIK